MTPVKVWQERVEIPTYETGPQDIHPMFLENRVYQGSSGAVYPYGVTDTLSEQKTLKSWQAVWLENDYIKVMILPELGGRVHRAWDKVKQRDFVYHNEVIKPALVGLLGPWISGGIEFNWPQHHRPTTFMPVDFTLEAHDDGAQTVWVGETEPMHGLQVMTGFTLRPDRAALEIASRVYNGNATPRHFLWWANPAVNCLLYTNPHPGICDVCQSALGGLFPSGSFLPPRQRFFELFPHPLIFSYISFSSGLLWYFLIVIHGLTSSLDMPVSVIRVVHDALCHWPLLSLSMQVFLL